MVFSCVYLRKITWSVTGCVNPLMSMYQSFKTNLYFKMRAMWYDKIYSYRVWYDMFNYISHDMIRYIHVVHHIWYTIWFDMQWACKDDMTSGDTHCMRNGGWAGCEDHWGFHSRGRSPPLRRWRFVGSYDVSQFYTQYWIFDCERAY